MSSEGGFDKAKRELLARLREGNDASPKGCIDLPCLDLVNFINEQLDDYVTTSSCSGRISVYRSHSRRNDVASSDNKGVQWVLVKHGCLARDLFLACVNEALAEDYDKDEDCRGQPLMLKCEGAILHVKCRDVKAAAKLHQLSIAAGYREGGITVGQHNIMLAIRTTAFMLESPMSTSDATPLPIPFLDLLLEECNHRMLQNTVRLGKLQRLLSEAFAFPTLYPKSLLKENVGDVARIGLMAARVAGEVICLGGQGRSNGRDQAAVFYGSATSSQKGSEVLPSSIIHGVMLPLHLRAAADILLVSGGRISPLDASSCLSLYKCDVIKGVATPLLTPIHFEQDGEIPCGRWGHSLVHLMHFGDGRDRGVSSAIERDEAVYLLCGGRDQQQVFGDCYLLTIRLISSVFQATWRRLHLQKCKGTEALFPTEVWNDDKQNVLSGDDKMLQRFSHASTLVSNPFDSTSPLVVLHGGLQDLNVDFGAPDNGSAVVMLNPKTEKWSAVTYDPIPRALFGHRLVDVGYGVYLRIGGTPLVGDCLSSSGKGYPSIVKLELQWIEGLGWAGKECEVKVNTSSVMPCLDCRCHFQAMMVPSQLEDKFSRNSTRYQQKSCELLLLGGGSSVGFATHFCCDVRALMACGNQRVEKSNKTPTSLSSPSAFSLVVPTASARSVKLYLEAKGWLDKSRRIGDYLSPNLTGQNEDLTFILKVDAADVRLAELTRKRENERQPDRKDRTSGTTKLQGDNGGFKTIPVSPIFLKVFLLGEQKSSPAKSADIAELLLAVSGVSNSTSIFEDGTLQLQLRLARQDGLGAASLSSFQSKQRQDRLRGAVDALRRIVEYCSGAETVNKLGDETESNIKFEIVGGVEAIVMVPEGLIEKFLDTSDKNSFKADSRADLDALWRNFLVNFKSSVTRVACKRPIASGPRRESQVRLLYPLPPIAETTDDDSVTPTLLRGWRPQATGPGSPGWVRLVENGIVFEWDITRVMFCSGNVTERMRAGARRLPAPPRHVVVDLYAGIGYYTVPLLAGNKDCVVHACEWNDHSVLALKRNLETNRVQDRCRVWQGDNLSAFCTDETNDVVSPSQLLADVTCLDSIADSVSLGLLPSSRSGWLLAARALKKQGGQIWLHENVADTRKNIDVLSHEAEQFFVAELARLGKPLLAKCKHVEKVKNYAPRVVHVVLDIFCTKVDE